MNSNTTRHVLLNVISLYWR